MLDILGKSKGLVVAALFAFCVAPTFISFQPYWFSWDDSVYLQRSIAVSRAFWAGLAYKECIFRTIGSIAVSGAFSLPRLRLASAFERPGARCVNRSSLPLPGRITVGQGF